MQDPNEDTEWNDILRSRGILPPKEKGITEAEITQMIDSAVEKKQAEELRGTAKPIEDMTLDELNELEDVENERALLQFRNARMTEMMAQRSKPAFGSLMEITAHDYIPQVNKAGKTIWVVLHLFQPYVPLCNLINKHLGEMAIRFPHTKFIRSISTDCIKNYPNKNLPTIFVYLEGDLKFQLVGGHTFDGMNLRVQDLEWMLAERGAIITELDSDPRKEREIRDVMKIGLAEATRDSSDDDD